MQSGRWSRTRPISHQGECPARRLSQTPAQAEFESHIGRWLLSLVIFEPEGIFLELISRGFPGGYLTLNQEPASEILEPNSKVKAGISVCGRVLDKSVASEVVGSSGSVSCPGSHDVDGSAGDFLLFRCHTRSLS